MTKEIIAIIILNILVLLWAVKLGINKQINKKEEDMVKKKRSIVKGDFYTKKQLLKFGWRISYEGLYCIVFEKKMKQILWIKANNTIDMVWHD